MKPVMNLHTHTVRCHHASGTERDYIERAVACGYRVFGFADHAPMPFTGDYYSDYRMRVDETEDYIRTLLRLREEYADRIRILIGFEAEYYPDVFPRFMELVSRYPVDYLLLGQHFLGNEKGCPYSGRITSQEDLLERYVKQTTEGMETGVFTYLAHPDLAGWTGDPAVYEKHMLRLCEAAVRLNIPLELNGLGLIDRRHYPSDRFFRLASETGCRIVFGLDAHQPERVGDENMLCLADEMAGRCNLAITENIPVTRPVY